MVVINCFQLYNGMCFTYFLCLNRLKNLSAAVWSMNNITISMIFGLLFSTTSCFPMRDSDIQARNRRNWRNPQQSVERWRSPCGVDITSTQLHNKQAMSQSQSLPQHYETIWSKAQETKQRAAALKRLFVEARGEPDLEAHALPSLALSASDVESVQPEESVTEAFRDLAKLALHLKQMRLDEINFEGSKFASDYTELEEQGIYWLLCELHKLVKSLDSEIGSEIIDEIETVPVEMVSSRAVRLVRDFIVLEQLNGLLHKMIVKFQLLAAERHIL